MADQVNWGVLGTASIARRRFIPAVTKSEKARLAAVASREVEKAGRFASEFEIPKSYGSYDELLADPNVDAVYIPLPNHLHAQWVMKSAEAGKHVLCEKPLGVNPEECRRMIDACRKSGVLLMEGIMYRLHPRTVLMKEMLDSGKIGDVRTIISVNTHLKQPDPADARFSGEPGSGVLMDVGVYCVNVSRYLFGDEPEAVSGKAVYADASGVDTSFAGMLEFAGGRIALFDSSYGISYRQYLEAGGSGGALHVDRPFVPGDGAKTLDFTRQGSLDVERIEVPGADQFRVEIDAFSESILKGLPSPLDPECLYVRRRLRSW
jgi:predicted dehydrogenase